MVNLQDNATYSTQCQDPIKNFEVECVQAVTSQKYECGSEIYIAAYEDLTCTMKTSLGLPISVIVDWNGATADVVNVTNDLIDTDLVARSKGYTEQYPMEGIKTINLTAYNLHSEPIYGVVKYSHNFSQVVYVEYKVDEFELEGKEFWIIENGSKYQHHITKSNFY